ncbi:unnamed protein product [Phytomonas sp. EM1]|nr:unnamed protein product [Phytomonas sp. EM1]|eukprot:CCW63602.1 unnamed protein product [Phytomonas sp. isolate EM1]
MNTRKPVLNKVTDLHEAAEMILNWFEKENKPATVQSLTDALGSCAAKTLIQKTLENLSEQGKLRTKDLKKVRLFFLNMDAYNIRISGLMDTKNEVTETITETEHNTECIEEKNQLIEDILSVSRLIQEKEQLLTQLKQSLAVSERKEKLSLALAEVDAMEKQLLEARENAQLGDVSSCKGDYADDSMRRIVRRYQNARLLWRERKEYVERIVDGVLGDGCSARELADTFGIISDAQAGVSLSQSAVNLHRSFPSI